MGSFIKSIEEHAFSITSGNSSNSSNLGLGQDILKSVILPSQTGIDGGDGLSDMYVEFDLQSGPSRVVGTRATTGANLDVNLWVIEFGDQFDIQTGGLDLSDPVDTNTATISAVVLANTFGLWSYQGEASTAYGNMHTTLEFTDTTTLQAERSRFNDTDQVFGTYFVVEYIGPDGQGIDVQHGTVTIAGSASTATGTLSSINPDKSFISCTAEGGAATTPHNNTVYVEIVDSTTIRSTREGTPANAENARYQIAEFERIGETQQSVILDWTGASTTTSISEVTSSRSTVHTAPLTRSGNEGTAGVPGRREVLTLAKFNSTTEVGLERKISPDQNQNTSVQVVEWPVGRRIVFGVDR